MFTHIIKQLRCLPVTIARRHLCKSTSGSLVAIFILVACAPITPAPPTFTPAPTPTPSLLDLVQVFQDTYNNRDVEGVLALFVAEPSWGIAFSASGQKAVHNILEFQSAINVQLELSNCNLENGVVACEMKATDDCKPSDVEAYLYDAEFEFRDNKISIFTGSPTGEMWHSSVQRTSAQRMEWARTNLPDDYTKYSEAEWAKFYGTGDPAGNLSAHEFGELIDLFCTRYASSTK